LRYLDRGRAGLLRRVWDGGDSLLAYEAGLPQDALQPDIRVQPLVFTGALFQGIDASAGGVPEASLTEIDSQLPPE
jgi:hypothetical protein